MEEVTDKSWVDEMVQWKATPARLRSETALQFCDRNKVATSTFYYQLSKKENQERILEITLNKAKDEAPDVLDTLVLKAKAGDMKAMDIYVDSILKLAKNLDIKSDGKPLIQIVSAIAQKNGIIDSCTGNDS